MTEQHTHSTTQKLWQSSSDTGLDPMVTDYIIDRNLEADTKILPYDIQASQAHATMLGSCGLITPQQATQICDALDQIKTEFDQGQWSLEQALEDVHTAIESQLVKKCGDLGKRIHLGRSRNDQVLTAMRLMTRAELDVTIDKAKQTAQTLMTFARQYQNVPMPGFTHMQYAMPSSVGQWSAAFIESLINDIEVLKMTREILNQNPLGSAAGFGTHVPLDRDHTTKALGFAKTQISPIYCQNSRGKFETLALNALMQVMMTLGRLANDMVIFTSQHYRFFSIERNLTTGSSIMPQKRNPDIFEVMRANVHIVQSLAMQCQTVSHNLISGYNKDLKITKKPLIQGFEIVQKSLDMVTRCFPTLTVHEERLRACFNDTSIFAADAANDLVMKDGLSFRDAYRQVKDNLDGLTQYDVDTVLQNRPHIGATGNLCLDTYAGKLEDKK